MVILTGFADEISSDLEQQLDVLESEQISHLEFRGVWGKNVLSLSDEEIAAVKKRLDDRGFKVSSIGSPIGKISITDDFEPHMEKVKRAIYITRFFDAPYLRIFSFFIPEGKDPSDYRDEVMRRMKAITFAAEEAGVTLVHENEKDIYGDNAERCLDILQTCSSPNLRSAFDPANFVQCKVKPMTDAFPLLKPYVEYIHVKDAIFQSGKVVPAGQGDGELNQLLDVLKEKRYCGYMSLEPHLQAAEKFQGFSGPELFVVAVRALKSLLSDADMEWN